MSYIKILKCRRFHCNGRKPVIQPEVRIHQSEVRIKVPLQFLLLNIDS
jgi:hypothetical protein